MLDKRFDEPVFVADGKLLVREIACIEDALDFMLDWPEERRGTIFETARRACSAAFDRRYPVAAARKAFSSWAKSANVLEDGTELLPWMVKPQDSQGGILHN
jgi:hypothetical protein